MKAKTKYKLLKWIIIIGTPIYFFLISSFFALLKVDDIWGDMFDEGIQNFIQWFTLIFYRILIYIPLPLIIGIFRFDKRYKYSSRVVIWYNWMFSVYLLFYGIYEFAALDLMVKVDIFNKLSSILLILGYVFSYAMKKPISFDDPANILNKY